MKGKEYFTKSEAKEIRLLIQKKIESSPDKQKGIRQKIRDIGFFYSDFSSKKMAILLLILIP